MFPSAITSSVSPPATVEIESLSYETKDSLLRKLSEQLRIPDQARESLPHDFSVVLNGLDHAVAEEIKSIGRRNPAFRPMQQLCASPVLVTFGSLAANTDVLKADVDYLLCINEGSSVRTGRLTDEAKAPRVAIFPAPSDGQQDIRFGLIEDPSTRRAPDEPRFSAQSTGEDAVRLVAMAVHNVMKQLVDRHDGLRCVRATNKYTLHKELDSGEIVECDIVPAVVDNFKTYYALPPPQADVHARVGSLCKMDVTGLNARMTLGDSHPGLREVIRLLKLVAKARWPSVRPKEGLHTYSLHPLAVTVVALQVARGVSKEEWTLLGMTDQVHLCLDELLRVLKNPEAEVLLSPVTQRDLFWVFKKSDKMAPEDSMILRDGIVEVVKKLREMTSKDLLEKLTAWAGCRLAMP